MMKIFSNLDKYYLKNTDTTISYSGFKIFKENCFLHQAPRVISLILSLLNKEREGEEIPTYLVIQALKYIYQLGCGKNLNIQINLQKNDSSRFYYEATIDTKYYTEEFEKKLIENTRQYYQVHSQSWLCWSVPEYVRQALEKLKEEEDRAEKYYPTSKKVVLAVIEDTIIVKHHKQLASNESTGVSAMLHKDSKHDLLQIYNLFKRAPETLGEIIHRFGSFFEIEGSQIISDPTLDKDPIQFTNKLLELKKRADDLVNHQFLSNLNFQRRRDVTFQILLNKFEKAPVFLASYLDYEFKKGMKGNTEDEIESKLESLKGLIFLLNSRDAFLKIYTKQLSSRLLNGTTVSNDAEKSMYNLMQAEWGQMTVMKIKSMLQDMEMSKEMNNEFHQYLTATRTKLSIEMNVQVLTQGCWPESDAKKVKVPDELESSKEVFEKYYYKKYPGKILSWMMSLGDCELQGNFEKKYTLLVTNYQLCVLLLFNKRPQVTFEEIKHLYNIPDAELQAHTLALIRAGVLTKSNATQKKDESTTIEKDVLKEREFLIDAAIIRIMKSRRVLDYNSIQTETKKLITMFVPDPIIIKRRIESLCERDYMKRDENDK